nr:EGF receptor and Furin cysteine rich region and Fibronectin and Tyrosine protein kinase domain containing protein [Haemonchus contortus]
MMKRRKVREATTTNYYYDSESSSTHCSSLFSLRYLNGNMLILISIIVLCLCMQISDALPERRCGTLDIRNHPNQGYKLAGHKSISSNHVNCSVLEGSMVLSLIQNSNVTEADFPMFRHLREITGSLLIFHVRKLSTLSRIFPNLRIIGGQNLIQHFSLIIYQNEDLIDIGLTKLRLIRNGGVRVAENNKMCYSRYIDWKHLMAGPLNDILVDDSVEIGVGEGKILSCTDDCDVEDESKCRRVVHSRGEQLSCWNKHTCQEDCPYDRINGSVGPGCADSNGAKCHAQCVAGCTVPDDDTACYGCLHYNHNGACVEKCPRNLFVYLNRRCITEAECDSMPALRGGKDVHKPANGVCATICPEGMEEDPSNKKRCRKCAGECVRKCPGNITVDSMSKAMQLKHCSVIEGYLEVEMRVGMSAVAASQLTGIFGKITTIDGYFVVRLSPSFVNLHMFRSLTRITGRSLYRDKYAMSIFENSNLQKLFPPENRLVIDTGSVQFQNNRMLCYFRIKELMVKLGREQEMSEEDQSLSYYSNGDKAICEESSFNLTVVESAVSQTAFTLRWPALNTSDIDHRKFLGYDILYKEVAWADPNLSIDDDRSSCQDTDSWYYHFEGVNDNIERINGTGPEYVTAMIANSHIKPHTLYAAYVTTKMVRHQGARNAVSNIAFVRTRFAVPDPPRITKAEALGTDEILVEWDPPTQPNGDISHYVVSWRAMNDAYMNQHMGAAVCHDDLTRSLDLSLGLPDGLREPTTPAPRAVSVLLPDKGEPQSDTCPRNEGCCKCAPKAVSTELDEGVESQTAFENAVHNVVFVQNKEVARKRRAITTPAGSKDGYGSKLSTKSATTFRNSINALAEAARNDVITVNVTATSFAIKGLKHYTRYFIQVTVCQDPTAPETHCSAKRAWQVEWDPPTQPNGDISHYVVSWRAMNDAYMNQHMGAAVCHDDLTRSLDLSLGLPDGLREPTTPAPRAVSVLLPDKGEPQNDTCPRNEGCCKCAPKAVSTELDEGVESQTAFENAVHNVVFVQNKEVARKRRAITTPAGSKDGYGAKLSTKSATTSRNSINALAEAARNDVITVNVTATSFAIKGLKHYTRYFIQVTVCQDPTAPETHCSAKRAWQYVRTKPIMDADRVDNSTINVVVLNGTSDIRITWKKPVDPNGMIVAYKVKVMNTAKQSTPVDQCIPVSADWSPNVNGAVFKGLNDGAYRVELRTVSLVGVSQPTYAEELFEIYTPGFWTLKNILLTLFFLLLFAVIVGIVGYFFVKKYYSQKVKEYATQLISANPEYLSQADVYKPDEWELQRSDLTLDCEIGRGTFGKVYRGYGNNVLSRCGDTFGLCAIKTVTETANSAERLHFLLEANVMKSFSAEAFIVKLYGVVSDGQPVLVVMEMMEKGNLRDYLRSRRPGAEENVDNLPVPTIAEYYEWAAQIADGMAYLESIRFCHRDLAARNCMVHANNTVKIGDFGMARDIYYHEYYKPNGKRLMPVRWMAPESLRDGTFDMKSDVWSYGIVLYEMLTLGQQPYQGLANEEVLSFIGISRKTLDRPMDCPDFWYDLMVECWRYVPRERPTFRQIVEHLIPLASDQFREASWIYNHPATDYASDSEPIYVPDGQGMQLLATDETADEVEYRLANRAGGAKPRRGEGDSLDTDSEAEDEV